MLPSRGVLRSLPSARATSSISSQAISRSHRRLGDGRNFSSLRTTASGAAPWAGLRTSSGRLAGTVAIGGALQTRRAISLWGKSEPAPQQPAQIQTPSAPSPPVEPAASTAAAASPTPAAEPVSIPAEPSTLVDPTASSLPSIDAATLLDLPEQIGYLKTLGLDFGWGPSSVMQWALEHVHVYSGLPWIGSITVTAVLLRLLLLKPLLKAQETSAKLQLVQQNPQYEALKKASVEALSMGDTARTQELRRDLATMNKRAGVNPFNAAWGFLQIPFGYGMFRVLNGASSIPVPGFENGGFAWITDLSVPDPLYILPILGPISMFAMMKTAGANASPQQKAQQKILMWVIGPISVVVTLYLPAAVQWYFFVSGLIGVVQNYTLTRPAIRRALGLPVVGPSGGRRYNGGTISTTATYQAPSPRPGSEDGSMRGVVSSIQQTIHKARGGAGDYLEAQEKKAAAKEAAARAALLKKAQKEEMYGRRR
ncbi:Mitochondrial inner membrane protein OXA1 [Colletotrichum sp. SAR 10_70]|nr:Mitochondrial inner membrane protein OXA1 [Colletotrichum sp. SAR 10_71]KAI8187102.1 Mitochondrial inner membrane protein OXA1 [Colletotrichum sp. SAR 10_75]KAI8202496.1 Mitochondrial inner membrane protein OXA1 [Colletotrichum sp. SAR 10_70]